MLERKKKLTAKMEPFDSFWEAPDNIEKGYKSFFNFYRHNYLKHIPHNKNIKVLVVSCGPGYFVDMLNRHGYHDVLGIDSMADQLRYAEQRNLNCIQAEAYDYLCQHQDEFDVIYCEQEVNHLTKNEIMEFLDLFNGSLKPGGTLVLHALNGANPITGAEALAQNFDHYNSFTEYTFKQILEFKGYKNIQVFPLNLYVFFKNPLNYILIIMSKCYELFFTVSFIMYGKKNRLWTKKIGAVCKKGV